MDEFFHLSPGSMLWLQEVLSMNNQRQSAFSSYTNEPIVGFASKSVANGSGRENVNKRMIQFLKKSWTTRGRTATTGGMERGRGKKHVIGERLRREKHKRFYGALHKLLPPGTKSDQKSILEMAVKKIKELQKTEGELKRRNNEVEFILGARENNVTLEKAEIELQVGNPSSEIDSMLGVVKSLKYTNSTLTAIRSHFSQRQFSALLEVETKMKAADVEREVRRSLFEVERKFRDKS
ncbi:transcription factor bHLH92-like isoform X1 [Primulina eburnea]|uniref:transcription factor bHLH92-like isoform X1 n=1 Tax=Primulina eburnea TaxID=1245227 RepID=UPI003C6CAE0D